MEGQTGVEGSVQGCLGQLEVQSSLGSGDGCGLSLLGQLGVLPVQGADELLALRELLLRGVGLRACRPQQKGGLHGDLECMILRQRACLGEVPGKGADQLLALLLLCALGLRACRVNRAHSERD